MIEINFMLKSRRFCFGATIFLGVLAAFERRQDQHLDYHMEACRPRRVRNPNRLVSLEIDHSLFS